MKSGYKVLWTDHALNELEKTIEYLETDFSEKELKYNGVDSSKSKIIPQI
jgi:hypothetical protein